MQGPRDRRFHVRRLNIKVKKLLEFRNPILKMWMEATRVDHTKFVSKVSPRNLHFNYYQNSGGLTEFVVMTTKSKV